MKNNRLKEMRKERLMSLKNVSELVGTSITTISRYENNLIDRLDLDLIENIADVLGTSTAYLLGMTDNNQYVPEIKMDKYPENDYLRTVLATDNEMAPEIPEGAHVQIRGMKPNDKLIVGHFYYIEFHNKKCFRMVIDDPIDGVSLMPHNRSEQRIAYDKDFVKILGKVVSIKVFYLE